MGVKFIIFRETVYYKISKVYYPSDYDNEDNFVKDMKEYFCNFFDEVYELYEKQREIDEKKEKVEW